MIKAAAPGTTETISYKMPTYKYRGEPVVYFAVWKNHIGFYGWSALLLDAYRNEIREYQTSVDTITFPFDRPLPVTLVRKLVKAGVAEIEKRSKQK